MYQYTHQITVGDEPVNEIIELTYATGTLTLISSTEYIKDRLAGYFHWHDRQSLEQAIIMVENEEINTNEI